MILKQLKMGLMPLARKSFFDFLIEAPELDETLPHHAKANHFEDNRQDFRNFEHISTMPSGHRLFKEKNHSLDDMSEPHFFFVAHPSKAQKEMTMVTYRDHKRNHRLEFVGLNKGSELEPAEAFHHMVSEHGLRLASLNKHSTGTKETWAKLIDKPDTELHMIDRDNKQTPLESNYDDNYSSKNKAKRFLLIKKDK